MAGCIAIDDNGPAAGAAVLSQIKANKICSNDSPFCFLFQPTTFLAGSMEGPAPPPVFGHIVFSYISLGWVGFFSFTLFVEDPAVLLAFGVAGLPNGYVEGPSVLELKIY